MRVHESSQKLELLRLSLERRLKENSQESLQPPAGRTDGSEEPPSPHSSTSRCPLSTSPSLLSIRPASLTGVHHLQFYSDNKTYHFLKGLWMKKHIEREGASARGGFKMSTKQILKYILRKMSRFPGASWGLSMVYRTLTSGGWIIRTCNLLVLDSFGYKLPLPTRCKRKLGRKNPFDDVTRRQILELLHWQGIMRTGLRSVVFCSAVVIASAKPGQKYSRQL